MIYHFNDFDIKAVPYIADAYCKCGDILHEVSNGLMSVAFFCRKCKSVYRLIKLPKKQISKIFIKQSMEETEPKKKRKE